MAVTRQSYVEHGSHVCWNGNWQKQPTGNACACTCNVGSKVSDCTLAPSDCLLYRSKQLVITHFRLTLLMLLCPTLPSTTY